MAKGTIFRKPETAKEWSNPEVLIQGYGRLNLETLKKKIAKDHADAMRFLKMENYDNYEYAMKNLMEFVQAVLDVETEMNAPRYKRMKKRLKEEPANNVGGGKVAGLGVGAQGEPGFTKAQQRRWVKKNRSKRKDFSQFINK